jgi:RNA polymerase sigma-70 factor (ECF subfamily)
MEKLSGDDVTVLIEQLTKGNQSAASKLIPVVYEELRRLAAGYMRRERPNHTLQPTALVNEAYLKLIEQREVDWKGRAHFFGIASQIMRRILIDHARARLRDKRGGGATPVTFDEGLLFSPVQPSELVRLDEALERLAKLDPRQCRVVELRFLGGMNIEQTAEVLDISPTTVKREWTMARAWLYAELNESDGGLA